MNNKLTVIIIDPHKDEHDYSLIKTDKLFDECEDGFDIKHYYDATNMRERIFENRNFDAIVSIDENSELDYSELNNMPLEYRYRWIHYTGFDPHDIAYAIVNTTMSNLNRVREKPLFSIFTSTFNTKRELIDRVYSSLLAQTYNNWNWFIIDDSTNAFAREYIETLKDPRITVIVNRSKHGVIGFNKHVSAMACDGDFLVELDHDDELTPDCLQLIYEASLKYQDADFFYSDTLEEIGGVSVSYGEPGTFEYGMGNYRNEFVNGKMWTIALSPEPNAKSVRSIYCQPNHVRCWKKDFYHRIGGHNVNLSVLDDMDLNVRTFLNGKMCKIDKTLYIQHEGNGARGEGSGETTQSVRFGEIQRTNDFLRQLYDEQVHNRILELGFNDPIWIKEQNYGEMFMPVEKLDLLGYVYKP